MKQIKTILLLTLFCFSSPILFAQMDIEKIQVTTDSLTKELVQNLDLNKQQEDELKTLLFSSIAKEQALEDRLVMMEEIFKQQIEDAKVETNRQIEALLDEKQLKAFRKAKKKTISQ